MKKVALSEIKNDLSRYLRLAEREEVIITRHGKPAGVLIGFKSEDEWFECPAFDRFNRIRPSGPAASRCTERLRRLCRT